MNKKNGSIASTIRYIWGVTGITVLLIVCVEMLSVVILATVIPNARIGYDARVHADTYNDSDKAWLKDYYGEFLKTRVLWKPYVYWRYAPLNGRYINIHANGLRKTWNNGSGAAADRKRIFVFGGSTVWGTGARDEYTIPSFVSRILNLEKGLPAEVTNFGQSGYVTTQEVIALLKLIQDGQVPDLVIFYDGINDVFSAIQNREAGIPQNEFNRYIEFNSGTSVLRSAGNLVLNSSTFRVAKGFFNRLKRRRMIREGGIVSLAGASEAERRLCEQAVGTYRLNMAVVQQFAKEFGFKALFYWQPTIYSKAVKTKYEKTQELARFEAREPFLEADRIADTLVYPHFTNLSGMFRYHAEPLYIDEFHLGETGNELVARRIVDDIVALWGGI